VRREEARVKLLLIEPGASWSTLDVSIGLRAGLEHHGVQLVRYRLDERIDRSNRWLFSQWRRTKKSNPEIAKPNTADVFYQAGIGALEMALRHQVDAVFVVSAMFLHPDVIILMKRAGLRVVVLFTESPYDHEKEIAVAKLVDGCWTNERTVVAAFQAVNQNSGYLPHAWNPERHKAGPQPGDDTVLAHDVVFVGSAFQERVEWIKAIDWTGIDLGLYGSWKEVGARHPLAPFVRGQQITNVTTAALYRRAKIGLNLYRTSMGWGKHAPRIAHAESLNPRAYELAACGAFHLSTDRAEVREVFGALVPTFETPAEASTLIRRWLADDPGRARIQSQLPGRVAESSWLARSRQVIGDLQTLLHHRAA
jgi:spore maturation protein CgeB